MGHVNVHPEFDSPQSDSDEIPNQDQLKLKQQLHSEQQEPWKVQPIFIPCLPIRQSPFKNYTCRDLQTITKNNLLGPIQNGSLDQQMKIKNNQLQAVKQGLWNSVLYDIRILNILFDMLMPQECFELSMVSRRLSTLFYFYRLFHRPNNWNFTAYFLHKKIENEQKVSYHKLLNESYQEESEHSLDLDRLESLFLPEEDATQQVARVDKVMRVINMSGVGYFQGLNSIIIVLVSLFPDEISYWIAMMLIHKTENLNENPEIYMAVMQKIERQVKDKCPNLFNKLDKSDLGVQYFAMKWLMNLFSTDVSRSLVIHIWDLILNFGLPSLKWFTVSIFIHIEDSLQKIEDSDELNETIKNKLKELTQGDRALRILQTTRVLMSEQIYGQGCSQIISPWMSYREEQVNQLAHVKKVSVNDVGKNCSNMCQIEQQAHAQQETSYQTFQSQACQDKQQLQKQEQEDSPMKKTEQIQHMSLAASILQYSQILALKQQQSRMLESPPKQPEPCVQNQ